MTQPTVLKINQLIEFTIDKGNQKKVINFFFPISRTKKIQLVRNLKNDNFEAKEITKNLNKKIILRNFFKREICITSIDNFYKTLQDRDKMSKSIHPLFKTRGVPGTHETNLLKKFFSKARKKKFNKFKLPKFDKSVDERLKKKYWFNRQ